MKVQEVVLEENKKRYMLLEDNGFPIVAVAKYLKYLDNVGKSRNTQKSYCYDLKHYFEFLKQMDKDYSEVSINDLSNFVGWLRNPNKNSKVINLKPVKSTKTERTINHIITAVSNFYDYIYRTEEIENDMIDKLMKLIYTGSNRRYKDFLYHVNKDKPINKNILILKEPRRKLKILTKEQVEQVYESTTNIRDRFLIQLLFETGLRIGEALSLFLEDLIFDHKNGHRIKLVDRGELPNGAKLKTGEREIYVSQELMDLFDDYAYEILDELEIDTNFLFIKLRGQNKGKPMEYSDVSDLFKRIKKKTGIKKLHPHLFRHTHATIYYQVIKDQGKDIKLVQERLGHAQIQTTIDMYLHPSDEDIRKGWEKAQDAFKIPTLDINVEDLPF